MKVKELIEELKKYNLDLDVKVYSCDDSWSDDIRDVREAPGPVVIIEQEFK